MNNRRTEVARNYHNQTKHSYWSVRQGGHFLDWANQPLSFKIYRELEPIPLPREWDASGVPALVAISSPPPTEEAESVPDLKKLAQVLFFSAGITKKKTYPGGEIVFRAASCTGALYEVELYVVCGDLPGLAAGVYHFNPGDFALRCLRQGDYRGAVRRACSDEAVIHAPAVIVATGTYWRNAWKYQARTYRHFGWDNGTLTANLLAIAAGLRLPARLVLGFVDEEVNRLLDLEVDREVVLSLVSVGRTSQKAPESHPPLHPLRLQTVPLSGSEVGYPEMRETHASTCLSSPQEVVAWRGSPLPHRLPLPGGPLFPLKPPAQGEMSQRSLEETILRRGSSREFERRPISVGELSTLLFRCSPGVPADFLEPYGESLNDWYLIVHAVEELPPGAYLLHRGRGTDVGQLELLKEGSFRAEAGYLGLQQELPADASVDIFFLADLNPILERFGNRGYRAVQLEAGILGGRIYLAAYAQRLGATGLTFYDDDVVEFFSPHAAGKSAIFLMAVGRGRKSSLVTL